MRMNMDVHGMLLPVILLQQRVT
jgi:hypothetical protein